MTKFTFYVSLLALVLIFSCKSTPVIIDINKILVTSCDGDKLVIDVKTVIDNPNSFDLRLKNAKMQFYYNGILLGDGLIEKDILLEKKEMSIIPVTCNLKLKELSETFNSISKTDSFLLTSLINAEISPLNITVNRKIVSYLNTKEVLNKVVSESIGKNIFFRSLERIEPGIEISNLNLIIQFHNSLPINYEVTEVMVDIYNDKTKSSLLGSSENHTNTEVKSNSATDLNVDVKLNNLNTLKGIASKIIRMDNTLYLEGFIKVKIGRYLFKVPVKEKLSVSV